MAAVGIKIENCKNGQITKCHFHELETGIDVSDSDHINVDGAVFDNVGTGLKARNVRGLKASNCTDMQKIALKLTPAAQLVLWYIGILRNGG